MMLAQRHAERRESQGMSEPGPQESFFRRYLEPADRLNEILFGLIMVLTFTLTAGLEVGDEPGAARTLLIATLGCNLAWGIIDGAMYLMGALLERSRRARAVGAVRAATDEAAAFAEIERALEGTLTSLATEDERAKLYRVVYDVVRRTPPERTRLRREDLYGAVASGVLVVLSTVPAALPFLLIDQPWRALRASNALLVGLLFVVGYEWGRQAHASPWRSGLAFLSAGLALVAIAIALGG
jgi:VIT1/CCC1 family predicted Fe2+/Mn2+ transporter